MRFRPAGRPGPGAPPPGIPRGDPSRLSRSSIPSSAGAPRRLRDVPGWPSPSDPADRGRRRAARTIRSRSRHLRRRSTTPRPSGGAPHPRGSWPWSSWSLSQHRSVRPPPVGRRRAIARGRPRRPARQRHPTAFHPPLNQVGGLGGGFLADISATGVSGGRWFAGPHDASPSASRDRVTSSAATLKVRSFAFPAPGPAPAHSVPSGIDGRREDSLRRNEARTQCSRSQQGNVDRRGNGSRPRPVFPGTRLYRPQSLHDTPCLTGAGPPHTVPSRCHGPAFRSPPAPGDPSDAGGRVAATGRSDRCLVAAPRGFDRDRVATIARQGDGSAAAHLIGWTREGRAEAEPPPMRRHAVAAVPARPARPRTTVHPAAGTGWATPASAGRTRPTPSSRVRLRRRALIATRAELPDMAKAAISGLSSSG